MLYKHLVFLMITTMIISGCDNKDKVSLRTGDLLFRGKTPSAFSTAIDDVTQTDAGKHFSHVGLAEVVDEEVFVIHAEGSRGVCREQLSDFMSDPEGNQLYVEAYRLKGDKKRVVDSALVRASSLIGEPYNYSYIIEDPGFYCSELIWYAFATDSVFSLEPMTFKDPATGEFHDGWRKHYSRLGIEIPEGLPGCNPNGMAASDRLDLLGVVESQP
ncbi:permuted papain-like amidase YaeF/Yiix C92 family enzyme [Marinilabilia salmonicolor]|jgi:uncharacterized protein YycO|nr:permuted papain-like amidase YaeF/Yiix C92 family enzyme [Marinilabilia salmonicolor]